MNDLGMVPDKYAEGGQRHKLEFRFLSKALITREAFEKQGIPVDEEQVGKPYLYTKWLPASLHTKSNLYKLFKPAGFLPPDDTELEDWEALFQHMKGRNALMTVELVPREGKPPFAAVQSLAPLMEGMEPITIPPDYVRVKDREQATDFNYGANRSDEGAPEGAE